ncbi:MAG: hypothetical protein QOH80_167, partial [Actinomycetota bacterium]|nr:hypothetical protein [Actinomycetota bacterium]
QEWQWGANDGCNETSGTFGVTSPGEFTAIAQGMTYALCMEIKAGGEVPAAGVRENVTVPAEADQANIIPASGTQPARLLLSKSGVVTGVYDLMPGPDRA